MQKMTLIIFISLLSVVFACSLVVNPAGEVNNLIKNGSFEENSKPTLKYWFGLDSSVAKLVKDAPERGGEWSVAIPLHRLEPLNFRLAQAVNLHSGTHILQFSFWGIWSKTDKSLPGYANLIRKTKDGKLIDEGGLAVKDTTWTQYTLLDTVHLQEGEKLYVNLSGGAAELSTSSTTSFDLVSLTETGSSK